MFIVFCLLVLIAGSSVAEEESLLVAYCKQSAKGEWRDKLQNMLAITKIGMTELFCDNVPQNGIAVATVIGGKYEVVVKSEDQNIDDFLANILKKMSSSRIKQISHPTELEEILTTDQEIILAFIRGQDSLEHRVFQQLALSIGVPDNLIIAAIHHPELVSTDVVLNSSKAMELWFIKNKKWVALHLKDIEDEITPEEIHYHILTYVRHIKYPPFFVYTGDDFEDEYSGSRLDFLLVFHTADQQEEMKKKIVIPLSEEFRLYYAFILIDGEKYPEMMKKYKVQDKSLPHLLALKNEQTRGISIDGSKVPYTVDSLINILTLVRKETPRTLSVESDDEEEQSSSDEPPSSDHQPHTEL